jgi:ABC-type glycerol-3-phosphate transport system substrate-binding protein
MTIRTPSRLHRLLSAGTALAAALVLAACGGDDDKKAATPPGTIGPTLPPCVGGAV